MQSHKKDKRRKLYKAKRKCDSREKKYWNVNGLTSRDERRGEACGIIKNRGENCPDKNKQAPAAARLLGLFETLKVCSPSLLASKLGWIASSTLQAIPQRFYLRVSIICPNQKHNKPNSTFLSDYI